MPSWCQKGTGGDQDPRRWGRGNDTVSPPELFLLEVGSSESHFNVSLIVRGKVSKTSCVHKPQLFEEKEWD